jgi:phage gp36-like protein
MPLGANVYCSINEVERIISAAGVVSFADHDQSGTSDSDVVEDCINQACDELDRYLLQRYTQAGLLTSSLVNRWAAKVAVYFLCQLRGNPVPESIQAEFDRILKEPDGAAILAAKGNPPLPGVPLAAFMAPTFANMRVDRAYGTKSIRRQPESSGTDTTTLPRDNARNLGGYIG